MKSLYFYLIFLFIVNTYSQNCPGGVYDPEVWFVTVEDEVMNNQINNLSNNIIEINICDDIDLSILNFNLSIFSGKLCLKYLTKIESTTGKDFFMVTKPKDITKNYSYLNASWCEFCPEISVQINPNDLISINDSLSRNFFSLNKSNHYAWETKSNYSSDKNAHVNFFRNLYFNQNKLFRSFGFLGESYINIGSLSNFQEFYTDELFQFEGHLPEYISFDRVLTGNEILRVESYLALKYGLTLSEKKNYLSSNNLVFWNKSNNKLFRNRIFGVGKDEISNLNQLISQSTHLEDHLICAVDGIALTNLDKQGQVEIKDKHFIVFGDNGKRTDLVNSNSKVERFMDKIWLAQITGEESKTYSMSFKLHLTPEIISFLNEGRRLWMLHDKLIGYDQISDFEGNHIVYYTTDNIDFSENVAYFDGVFFDTDDSQYDQFTFGVGPEMIVQLSTMGCAFEEIKLVVNVYGGNPEYKIFCEGTDLAFDDTFETSPYSFVVENGNYYHITVFDSNMIEVIEEITISAWDFWVDLGSEILLDINNPTVLNAGVGIDDPDAIYVWYHNGTQMNHSSSTLEVTEPGEYTVIITSADQSCTVSSSANVINVLKVEYTAISGCTPSSNALTIHPIAGSPPFVTNIQGDGFDVNYPHNETTTVFDFPFGNYTITTTDVHGDVFTDVIAFLQPDFVEEFHNNLANQLSDLVSNNQIFINGTDNNGNNVYSYVSSNSQVVLDSSIFNYNVPLIYNWFVDDVLIDISSSVIVMEPDDANCDDFLSNTHEVKAIAFNPLLNCLSEFSFIFKFICTIKNINSNTAVSKITTEATEIVESTSEKFLTKVYPNPSSSDQRFYYDVSGENEFSGVVEIYNMNGVLVQKVPVGNSSRYILPFTLQTAGTYLIHLTTSSGVVKTDRVIIK